MTRDELYQRVFESPMFRQWHWLHWHFNHRLHGSNHPLAESIIGACLDCDTALPGSAFHFIDALAAIGGQERHEPHWEQLLQCMAEILIVRQLLTHPWPPGTTYALEPAAHGGGRNPEIGINTPDYYLAVEVKAPALFEHSRKRATNPTQLSARVLPKEATANLPGAANGLTLPRDNPVKDFLESADAKFTQLRPVIHKTFFGLLVIVWDDHIYEPISALSNQVSGLLTPNTFAKDQLGNPATFPAVDGVVLVRHLHQLVHACADEPLSDGCRHALDYGNAGQFPFKAFIPNPAGQAVPPEVLQALQATEPCAAMGAEYLPSDMVFWIDS